MKRFPFILTLLAAATGLIHAQVVTEAVGFNTVTCLAGSDTRCSVPLTAETAFVGVVSSTSVPAAGQLTIVPTASAPGWTANQFATSYYVKLTSGSKAGMYYQILSNTTTDITVDLAGDTAGIGATDGVKICKFWTLATLFPLASQTTIHCSLNNFLPQRKSQILLPDLTGLGINRAPTRTLFLVGTGFVGTEWRDATNGNIPANNTLIAPDTYFIVRHPTGVAATTYTITGGVDMSANATVLNTQTNAKQDNPVTHGRPVPVRLADLDLISTGAFIASAGNFLPQRRDELLVYSNTATGINKAATATYFYVNGSPGEWRNASNGNVNADNDLIQPSEGFVIRKYQAATQPVWTESF